MKLRYTQLAEKDIVRILLSTIRLFGPQQAERYREVIRAGVLLAAGDPARAGSKACDDIQHGVRAFHLQFAARRRGGASHIIYYRLSETEDGTSEVIVLRVLADRMVPTRRVRTAPAR